MVLVEIGDYDYEGEGMTKEEHIEIHKDLHKKLDELVADFLTHTEKLPNSTTLLDFMTWAHEQTLDPTPDRK